MDKRRWQNYLLLACLAFFFIPSLAYGDLFWVAEQLTKGMPGQPDAKKIIKTYAVSNALRIESGTEVTVIDLDEETVYGIDSVRKTYTETDMKKMSGMPGIDEQMTPEEKVLFENFMKNVSQTMQIIPTDQAKQIAGYNCKKYIMTVMGMETEYWISKEVEGYAELKSLGSKMAKISEKNPILRNMNIGGLMNELDGFPVQIIMNVMGGEMTTTLQKVEQKTLEKKLFEVPAGYRLHTF